MRAFFDDASPNVAELMARARLTKELRGLKAQIVALGQDPVSMLKAARLTEQLRKIRKQLGGPVVPVVKQETDEPAQVKTLREVTSGMHDSKGLPELFGIIQEAVNGLDEAGLLSGGAEVVANDATVHWENLEDRLNATA